MKQLTNPRKRQFVSPYSSDKEPKTYVIFTDQVISDLRQIAIEAMAHRDTTATDQGTCVLGAGVKVMGFKPRKKFPESLKMISAPFQGNTGSYKALKPCLEYLQKNYPELHAFWDDGNMD